MDRSFIEGSSEVLVQTSFVVEGVPYTAQLERCTGRAKASATELCVDVRRDVDNRLILCGCNWVENAVRGGWVSHDRMSEVHREEDGVLRAAATNALRERLGLSPLA